MHMHTHRLKAQCQGPWWLEAYERVGLTRGCQVYGNKRNSQANESQNLWHTRAHTHTNRHTQSAVSDSRVLSASDSMCVCRCACRREFSISVGAQRLLLIGKCDDTTQEAIDLPSDGDWFNSSSFQVRVCVCACIDHQQSIQWDATKNIPPSLYLCLLLLPQDFFFLNHLQQIYLPLPLSRFSSSSPSSSSFEEWEILECSVLFHAFFVAFFTVNFIKRSSVAAEAHKRGCRVISFLTFKHFQLNWHIILHIV